MLIGNQKDYEKGYSVLVEGLSHHESNADFHFVMAYYLFMLGKPKQAEVLMIKALEMDYEGHKRLFSTFPEARNNPEVADLIESFKKSPEQSI